MRLLLYDALEHAVTLCTLISHLLPRRFPQGAQALAAISIAGRGDAHASKTTTGTAAQPV